MQGYALEKAHLYKSKQRKTQNMIKSLVSKASNSNIISTKTIQHRKKIRRFQIEPIKENQKGKFIQQKNKQTNIDPIPILCQAE